MSSSRNYALASGIHAKDSTDPGVLRRRTPISLRLFWRLGALGSSVDF